MRKNKFKGICIEPAHTEIMSAEQSEQWNWYLFTNQFYANFNMSAMHLLCGISCKDCWKIH
ncbi:hypothetical protein T02_4063 [Trichinella nativa]|uniref:Uncharacterized protein n=1 Tax=Trichinella nativa TaxID=6335 RepID=A0A0V1L1Y9_9BILA|nr:hypothetical protein T02_4063 [Trichinella nativa]